MAFSTSAAATASTRERTADHRQSPLLCASSVISVSDVVPAIMLIRRARDSSGPSFNCFIQYPLRVLATA